jgi:formate hydrogenlyase subunit 4
MTTFTLTHVLISLVAILSGFAVLFGLLTAKRLDGWTALFLATTVLTSVTGFFFPFHGITPAIVVGIISLVVLAVAIFARYARNLSGAWRKTYVVTALLALYFNVFVLIVQAFQKIPALKEIAPTQKDPPFKLTQLVVLVAFLVLGILATIRFRAEPVSVSHSRKEIISAKQIQT